MRPKFSLSPSTRGHIKFAAIGEVADKQQTYERFRESLGYEQCPRCKKRFKNINQNHFSDFKNKTRCMEKVIAK